MLKGLWQKMYLTDWKPKGKIDVLGFNATGDCSSRPSDWRQTWEQEIILNKIRFKKNLSVNLNKTNNKGRNI